MNPYIIRGIGLNRWEYYSGTYHVKTVETRTSCIVTSQSILFPYSRLTHFSLCICSYCMMSDSSSEVIVCIFRECVWLLREPVWRLIRGFFGRSVELLNTDFWSKKNKTRCSSASSQPLTGLRGMMEDTRRLALSSFHVLSPTERGAVGRLSLHAVLRWRMETWGWIFKESNKHLMDCDVQKWRVIYSYVSGPIDVALKVANICKVVNLFGPVHISFVCNGLAWHSLCMALV